MSYVIGIENIGGDSLEWCHSVQYVLLENNWQTNKRIVCRERSRLRLQVYNKLCIVIRTYPVLSWSARIYESATILTIGENGIVSFDLYHIRQWSSNLYSSRQCSKCLSTCSPNWCRSVAKRLRSWLRNRSDGVCRYMGEESLHVYEQSL